MPNKYNLNSVTYKKRKDMYPKEKEIRKACVFLRESNNTIPSEIIQFMLKSSLAALKDVEKTETKEEIVFQIKNGTHKQFELMGDEVKCKCGHSAVWLRNGFVCGTITAYPCKY